MMADVSKTCSSEIASPLQVNDQCWNGAPLKVGLGSLDFKSAHVTPGLKIAREIAPSVPGGVTTARVATLVCEMEINFIS